MRSGRSLYPMLVRLYPRRFRDDFADDMVELFDELVECEGRAAAWRRVLADVVVTLPQYRLETLMAPQRSTSALAAIAVALGTGAVATLAVGLWPVAVILFAIAATIAVSERTHLARSLRPDSRSHRRKLFARSGILGLGAVGALVVGLIDLGNEAHWPAGRLLLYNALFFGAGVAALVQLLVAFRQPRNGSDLSSLPRPT